MSEFPEWLPPLVTLQEYKGNWWAYQEACYTYYCHDFVENKNPQYFKSKIVLTDTDITEYGWEETFRHIVLGGIKKEEQDMGRFEKIRWIRPMIEAADADRIPWWRNIRSSSVKRGSQKRLVIALPDFTYKIIMRETFNKYILFTAYPCYGHEIKVMKREYESGLQNI